MNDEIEIVHTDTITVGLIGNPNCGKTTLFNKLTGSSQRVGNWPGVTVERKVGRIRSHNIDVVDLPGIYSLTPYSPEEVVSRDFLTRDTPDVIVNIVEASNLERNLYLTSQVTESGIPTIIALNMMDIAENRGIKIDVQKMEKIMGCRIIPMSASKGEGVDDLIDAIKDCVGKVPNPLKFDDDTEEMISRIEKIIPDTEHINKRWYAVKLLENDELAHKKFSQYEELISSMISEYEKKKDDSGDAIIADARYNAICDMMALVRITPAENKETITDKIDRIVTNKWLGIPIFIAVMFGVYMLAMCNVDAFVSPGAWATDWLNGQLEGVNDSVREWLENAGVSDVVLGLVCDGVLKGVFAVLGFLPQMLVLFLLLCLLEDCGYMARVCFIMDRIFRHFNLSGKSFIPLLVSSGCGVPGVLSTRSIENDCDRRITAMTATFIPCSAKMPVIALIAGAIFGGSPVVALFTYLMGVLCVLISGIILKKFRSFKGEASVFIMELPPYHAPRVFTVIKAVFDRGWAFVKNAGTFILLASVLIWFLSTFNWSMDIVDPDGSILADIGNAVCWIFTPIGWGDSWELTVATAMGLVAKEDLVATFAILFGADVDAMMEVVIEAVNSNLSSSVDSILDETISALIASGVDASYFTEEVKEALREGIESAIAAGGMDDFAEDAVDPLYSSMKNDALSMALDHSSAKGLSFLVFNMICAPCFAAIGAIHRELGTWRSTGFAILYQCGLAYLMAGIVYAIGGLLFSNTPFESWMIFGFVFLIALILMIVLKDPFKHINSHLDARDARNL